MGIVSGPQAPCAAVDWRETQRQTLSRYKHHRIQYTVRPCSPSSFNSRAIFISLPVIYLISFRKVLATAT
jgi:hypothetical protein